MFQIAGSELIHLLTVYGYLAVLVFVAIESMGIPFPGETMLLTAAIYAGATHHLAIPLVIGAAAVGAILGDNLGFLVGREGGFRLARRYGHLIRLNERKLKVAIYLFRRHGGKVVFFGRFVAVLRAWSAFLAGTSCMSWGRFLVFNAAGGILWAVLYGLGGYLLGNSVQRFSGPFGEITVALAIVAIVVGVIVLWKRERQLEDEAERALPGPLDQYTHPLASNQRVTAAAATAPASDAPDAPRDATKS
jgi:membrane protein DedA with SNARE-associated domain